MSTNPTPNPYAAFGGVTAQQDSPSTQDPYAAFGGQAVPAQQPSASAAPAPAQGAWAYAKQGAAATMSAMLDPVKGIGEDLAGDAAGLNTLAHKAGEAIHTGLGEYVAPQKDIDTFNKLATPANTSQSIYKGAAEVGEFMLGDEALKGLSMGDKLKAIAPVVQRLEKSPALLRIAQRSMATAARQGVVGAVQGTAHTGDVSQGLTEGTVAGVTGGVLEGVSAIGGRALDKGGKILADLRPDTTDVAGVKMQRLASQRPDPLTGERAANPDATPENTPKYRKSQQLDMRRVEQNLAQDAGGNSIAESNRIRAQVEPAKVQPMPDDMGDEFHVPGQPSDAQATTPPSGTQSQYANASRVVRPNVTIEGGPLQITDGQPTLTSGSDVVPTTRGGVGMDQTPQLGEGSPTGQPTLTSGSDVVPTTRGGVGMDQTPQLGEGSPTGLRVTTDPGDAQQALSMLDEQADDGSLSPEMEQARQNLRGQVDMYHARLNSPGNVYVMDPQAAMSGVRTFGEAADRLNNIHKPVFNAIDAASGGEYAELRNAQKQATRVARTSGDMDQVDKANSRLHDIEQSMNQLFDMHGDVVSRHQVAAARQGYADEMVLRKTAAMVDNATNGISLADEAAKPGSFQKEYKGLTANAVQKLVQRDPRVGNMLGAEGVRNLKEMAGFQQAPKLREDGSKLSSMIGMHMAGHFIRGGAGALVGGEVSRASGGSFSEGALAGAAAGLGSRFVMRRLMTNPDAGRLFRYAVENRVNPKIAVPLLSGMISQPADTQQQDQQGGQQ
jgi:hypothetical protein